MMDVVKRALPFLLTLLVGVFLGSLFKTVTTNYTPKFAYVVKQESSGYEYRNRHGCRTRSYRSEDSAPVVTFKPLATYTESARQNEFEGTVRLLVEYRADGTIGDIDVLQGQPYGLTDEAKEAARDIRFKPATRNGEPVTVNKEVEFHFSLTQKF